MRTPPRWVHLVAALTALLLGCGARSGLDLRRADAGAGDGGRVDGGRVDGGPIDLGRSDGAVEPCPACDDGVFCNGAEGCAPDGRCLPGAPPTCDGGDECSVDTCDRTRDTCTNIPTERDEDGDGVSACGGDCDDRDPGVAPGLSELCDGRDQNCDGRIDEGVRSACDDCRPGCQRVRVPGDAPWPVGGDASGVEVDADGALVLSSTRTETHSAWIANTLFATVTRLDTRDGSQIGEYDSVLRDGANGAAPPGVECEVERSGGNCPSRTAVDLRGSVYIANRSFFGQGTITKIAGFESDCIDRDGDGTIDTSHDLDGDAVIERSVPGEFLGQADECLLWTVDVGAVDGVPRAIAIDAAGTVWVGLHNERRLVQLHPSDGRVLRTIDLPGGSLGGFQPYGAAADGAGRVWFVSAGTGSILGIDAATGAVIARTTATSRGAEGCSGSYGIAIDPSDRVWIAGFLCPFAFRYDPTTRAWREVALPSSGVTRGIAADADGNIYIASSHEWIRVSRDGTFSTSEPLARVTVIDAETLGSVRVLGTPAAPLPGRGTTGVGLDSAGFVWLVNQDSSSATRLDPRTGATREFATGISPYTYSDFTGYALRTFTAPNGYLRTIVAGCASGVTEWEQVRWNARVPAGTSVELRARTADAVPDLAGRPWVGPFSEGPVSELALPPGPVGSGRHLELEVSLLSDGSSSPAVDELVVQYNCP